MSAAGAEELRLQFVGGYPVSLHDEARNIRRGYRIERSYDLFGQSIAAANAAHESLPVTFLVLTSSSPASSLFACGGATKAMLVGVTVTWLPLVRIGAMVGRRHVPV